MIRDDSTLVTPAYMLVRDRLREEILTGRLAPGTRITIAEIAERYGVSQMPVREAFQGLQGEHLLELLPHRGARVRAITRRKVRDIYDLRGAVESLLARLAMPHLSAAMMKDIKDVHARFCAQVEQMDIDAMLALNNQFHNLIYRHSDNEEAYAVFERSAGLIASLRRTYGYGPGRCREIATQHEGIIAALAAQDEERVTRAMTEHCETAKQDLLARMPPNDSIKK
jgi:DNA-binding GntR family transcriptional regulator